MSLEDQLGQVRRRDQLHRFIDEAPDGAAIVVAIHNKVSTGMEAVGAYYDATTCDGPLAMWILERVKQLLLRTGL